MAVLLAAVLAVLAPVWLQLLRKNAEQRELEEHYAAIRATGAPATLKESAARYNAALAARAPGGAPLPREPRLMLEYSERSISDALNQIRDEELQAGARAARTAAYLSPYIAFHAEYLAKQHEGRRAGFGHAQVDLSKGDYVELPHLAPMRNAGRVLQWEMVYAAAVGDLPRVQDAFDTLIALTEALRGEPPHISQLVRIAIVQLPINAFCRSLSVADFPEPLLQHIEAGLARVEDTESLVRALEHQRCNGLDAYENERTVPGLLYDGETMALPAVALHGVRFLRNLNGSTAADRLQFLQKSAAAIAAARLPYPEMRAAIGAILDDRRANRSIANSGVAADLLSVYRYIAVAACRCAANLRCAAAVIALERYLLQHGNLPDSLATLPAEYLDCTLEDPFDGKPLRYRVDTRGYAVYSVGDNLKDDGGNDQRNPTQGDVVLRVVR